MTSNNGHNRTNKITFTSCMLKLTCISLLLNFCASINPFFLSEIIRSMKNEKKDTLQSTNYTPFRNKANKKIDESTSLFENEITQQKNTKNQHRREQFVGSIVSIQVMTGSTSLTTLMNGATIVLSDYNLLSPTKLNFNATTSGGIGSVQFLMQGNSTHSKIENSALYAACGNFGPIFFDCSNLKLGTTTLTTTPYQLSKGGGTPGVSLILTFTIVLSSAEPISTPVATPVQVPVASPVVAPITTPVTVPVQAPVSSPIQNSTCTTPMFVGAWERYTSTPMKLAESHGGKIGYDFILFGGFTERWSTTTNRFFTIDTTNPSAQWIELEKIPMPLGITHVGHVFVGNILYICGGFMPDPIATPLCKMYNHTKPNGTRWSNLPNLTDPIGRAGGALLYNENRDSLIWSGGDSKRLAKDSNGNTDRDTTWELLLNNQAAGWTNKTALPYLGNHVGYTTISDRHFVLGGQQGAKESSLNIKLFYEYNATSDTWTPKADIPFPRGHFSSSTTPYKNCGFIIAGGAINDGDQTPEITYYSIETNSWTKIGDLTQSLNTPVCSIINSIIKGD